MEAVYRKLVYGIRNYFADHGFLQAAIALSGGIDSAVVVALAVEALGRENVRVLLLPSAVSSDHSVDDSLEMVRRADIKSDTIYIEPIFDAAIKGLDPIFSGTATGLAEENLQSRIRMLLTMAVCNKTGALMLNTSNKSEIMVGYGTLYGDTCGAISVIGNLYKTDVYKLADYINSVQNNIIPQNIIDKAPSAELRPGQLDSDSLPPYEVLDRVLYQMVDLGRSVDEISADGFDSQVVAKIYKLWRSSAFKRPQLPPAIEL